MALIGLWLTYAAAAAAALWLARRYGSPIPAWAALVLALLPLLFVGRAMLNGGVYGPSDLYFEADPWRRLAMAREVGTPRNPILSDLAFANLPWRAAVRDAVVNGRAPLWNRFVLGGNPLVGAAQAGVFHPSTVLGVWLPLPMSWTFSCALTLFLALLSAFVLFRDLGLGARAALVGAIGWGFSTYVVFWNGWSVGPSTATFPLLVLGLRRLVREPGRGGVGLTAAALGLSLLGGHPESLLHTAAAGGVCFLWELFDHRASRAPAGRAILGALVAGILAALVTAPQLFPLLEALPHSAEYRQRRRALEAGPARQSVSVSESAARLLPDLLPFSHGIYGRSAVDERGDGSGMPLGYAGAILFPLSVLAFVGPGRRKERWLFLLLAAAGVGYGASVPGLLDLTSRLPGFALALNYRLVFLAGFGLAGLAALGTEALDESEGAARRLGIASAGVAALLGAAYLAARPVFADRKLDPTFARREFLVEVLPVALLAAAAAAARRRPRAVAEAALVYLVLQRFLEMNGTYPTLPAGTLAPRLPTLATLPVGSDPARIVAEGGIFRPNAAALYGVEDVRGYESIVLDRFADTFPLWSSPQSASFNRVDDSGRPFLAFLNARFAVGAPDAAVPDGWLEQARGPELAIFANPRALPRAFVPRVVRAVRDPLSEMASVRDFEDVAFVEEGAAVSESPNPPAELSLRESGPDLFVEVSSPSPVFVATSIPDWPGWTVTTKGAAIPTVTVNHAFVGFRLGAGRQTVRLRYEPRSWRWGLGAAAAGVVLVAILSVRRRGKHGTGAFRDS
jgi:hypothetical protein